MKTTIKIFGFVAAVALLSAPGVYAQNNDSNAEEANSSPAVRNPSGQRSGTAGAGRYNPQTVETLSGEVLKVEEVQRPNGIGRGVHLLVKTEMGNYPVFLGPEWFLDKQKLQIQPHDQVEIKGSRITVRGREAFIAAEVKHQDQTLKLRNESGIPLWAGQGRRGGGNEGLSMTGRNPKHEQMGAGRQHWIEQHKKAVEALEKMDEQLQQKADAMNEAQGQEKIDAMAAAINELVQQRLTIDKHIAQFAEQRMAHMERMRGMMGQKQMGQGGTGSSSKTERGENESEDAPENEE